MASLIKVIDEEGKALGDMTVAEGLVLAEKATLDLVEVSPNAPVPVCRLMDYGRYRFKNQKKTSAEKTE